MSKIEKFDLIVAGVGGQGVVLASDIIAEAALASGYDVKKTDTIGMAQRGGSVISHVRMAPKVWSPLIKQGEVDVVLAFEKMEAVRWGHYLKQGGIAIINNQASPPLSVNLGNDKYPSDDEIAGVLKNWTNRIYFIDGARRAAELGNSRVLNTFMLGCVSSFMPVELRVWKVIISGRLPPNVAALNIIAFEQGRKEVAGAHI